MPDVLTHPCNARDHHHRLSALLLLVPSGLLVFNTSGSGGGAEVGRITILLEDSGQVTHFLLKVVLWADDLSGPVVKTLHQTSLHMGWVVGSKVEVPVGVCGVPVDSSDV